jgi:hypothetical protein
MARIFKILVVVLVSAAIAWCAEPHVRDNKDFFIAIVTIFSVFAGFLVAVMSVAGDPLISKSGSWSVVELGRDTAVNKMNRAQLLFYVYLIAATLILVVIALQNTCDPLLKEVLRWTDLIGMWFAAMGVLFSFALPTMLLGIQKDRIDAEIERRR